MHIHAKRLAVTLFLVVFLLFLSPMVVSVNADSSIIAPSDDSWIDYNFPDSNYNWQEMVHVMRGATIRRSYFKFDLSSLPAEQVLNQVKLYLYCTADDSYNLTVNIHETTDAWDETSLTWNNAPNVGAYVTGLEVGGKYSYYSWDITLYAQTQYDGDKILSIVLKSPLDDPAGLPYALTTHRDFASKESPGTDYDPFIEVIYEPKQYYLSVASAYGVPGGEGWYDSGTTTYATLNTGTIDQGNGTRRIFTSWSGDATGTNYVSSDSITMNGNKTAVANWKTQYYLSVASAYGVPGGEGWYDSGTTTYATLNTGTIDQGNGTRRIFTSWSGDATGTNYAQSSNIIMNGPKHVVAEWKTQVYLTLESDPSGITIPSGEGWYDVGMDTTISTDESIEISPGLSRYKFYGWTTADISEIANPSSPVTTVLMDKPKIVTANYNTQYYLTVLSPYNSPSPTSGWFNSGSSITASVTSPTPGAPGTRYVCIGWIGTGSVPSSGTAKSVTFTISQPSSISWNWRTQHYLRVKTNPLGITPIQGEGWYAESSSVHLGAPYVMGFRFLHWEVDGTPQEEEVKFITVNMDAPHNATANYEQRPAVIGGSTISIKSPIFPTWLSVNMILIGAIIATAFLIKRRHRKANLMRKH